MRLVVSALVCAVALGSGVAAQDAAPPLGPNAVTLKSGVKYEDLRVGKGAEADATSRLRLLYTGYLPDGRIFDSRTDRTRPLDTTFGEGRIIKGMEEGVAGMRVGGRRRIFIPAKLAYGARGTTGIPPNSDLTFDVELVGVARPRP